MMVYFAVRLVLSIVELAMQVARIAAGLVGLARRRRASDKPKSG